MLYYHTITYAPSASALVNILALDHDQLRQKDLLAVGDPEEECAPENYSEELQHKFTKFIIYP